MDQKINAPTATPIASSTYRPANLTKLLSIGTSQTISACPSFTAHATVDQIEKPRRRERGPPAVRADPMLRNIAVPG